MNDSVFEHGSAEGEPTVPKLVSLLTGIDNARESMQKASERYRSIPTKKYLETFAATARLNIVAVAQTVEHIVCDDSDGDTPLEKAQLILQILTEDDTLRMEHFSALVEGQTFHPAALAEQGFVANVAKLLIENDNDPEIANLIMTQYVQFTEVDYSKFIRAVGETKNAKALEVAKKMGHEALTFSKISAAMAVGAYIGTRHLRKK